MPSVLLKKLRKVSPRTLLLCVCIFLLILGNYIFKSIKNPQTKTLVDPQTSITVINPTPIKIVFLKDDNLYTLDTSNIIKQLTHFPTRSIASYHFDPSKNIVTYVSGSPTGKNGDVIPNEVHVISLATNEDTKIYSYDPKLSDDGDYVIDRIRAARISPYTGQIALVTDDTVSLFDLDQKTITHIFTKKRTITENDPYDLMNGSFSHVIFSPDGTHLLVRNQFHEGLNYHLFNIQTKSMTELFTTGTLHDSLSVLGWLDNDTVLITEYHDDEHNVQSQRNKTGFYRYNIDNKSKTLLYQVAADDGTVSAPTLFKDHVVYWHNDQISSLDLQTKKLTQLTFIPENEIVNGMIGTMTAYPTENILLYARSKVEMRLGMGIDWYHPYSLYSMDPTIPNSSKEILDEVHF